MEGKASILPEVKCQRPSHVPTDFHDAWGDLDTMTWHQAT